MNLIKKKLKYGRLVKNFDKEIWDTVKFDIIYQANFLKYSQNKDLLKLFQLNKIS
jgi:predicted NAD-dependent protein-ADP-ribosyltransferase YbiA (DUF1768 family)